MNKRIKTMMTCLLLMAATHVMGYTISVSPVEIAAGQTANLVINLTNSETNLTAYQMLLYLPDGITVQKKSNGKYDYTYNASRHDGAFTFTVKDAADGSVLIACFSTDKDVLSGNSGELITLPLEVAQTVDTSLEGSLRNIEFTDVNTQAQKADDVSFELTLAEQQTDDDDDIDLSQYTLVKDLDLGSYGDANNIYNLIGIDIYDPKGTAYHHSNYNYPTLYNVLTPEDWHDVLALQAVYSNDGDGKGWFIYKDQGIYSKSADRAAAVINRQAGDLIIFETTKNSIEDVMTLYNAEGQSNGPFTYTKSTSGQKYYVTMTGDGSIGFCSYHNNYPVITRIRIYEPNEKPISVKADDLTINYGDALPTLTWTATKNGQTANISGTPSLYTWADLNSNPGSKPGTYTIFCEQGSVATSGVLFANGTLTIDKSTVTVTAPTLTITRGDAIPDLTPTYTGFVNGWTADQLPYQAICTTDATSDSPAGTYTITFSQNPNSGGYYNFDLVEGTLTIVEQSQPEQPTIEVTDISQMDNAIYIEPFTARAGEDVQIEVKLKNAEAATSYGFELVLPEGMTIAVNSDNEFDDELTLSSRNSKHSATTNLLANGNYKIGVASMSSKAITGNEGTVLTITAHMSEDMAEGDYPIQIASPLLVSTDASKPTILATQTKVTVENYVKGDVDGDGVVDLADAVLVINYYVGKAVNLPVAQAADVDGDGTIDLADAVKIINFYVGKVPSLSRQALIDERDPQ